MARGRPATPLGTHGKINGPKPLPDGGYICYTRLRLYNGQLVQVQGTGPTEAAAKAQIEVNCAARLKGEDSDTLTTTSTLKALLDEWLPRHDVSESSKDTYSKCIRLHVEPALGGVRLNELTTPMLQKFLEMLTPATAKTARALLSSAVGMAVRWGVMSSNPVRETKLRKRRRQEIRVLTAAEMDEYRERLVEWCGGNDMGPKRGEGLVEIVDVLRGSGMRIGEVLALRWQDVDLDAGTVTVAGTTDNKGGRNDFPKTELSRRTISVTQGALDALKRQAAKDYVEVMGEPVFPTKNGTYRSVPNTQTRLRDARGDLKIQPHDFRRTVATRIEEKFGLLAASRHLGHANTKVTESAYLAAPKVIPDYTEAF